MLTAKMYFSYDSKCRLGGVDAIHAKIPSYRIGDGKSIQSLNKVVVHKSGMRVGIYDNLDLLEKDLNKLVAPMNLIGCVGFDPSDKIKNSKNIFVFNLRKDKFYIFHAVNGKDASCTLTKTNDDDLFKINKAEKTNKPIDKTTEKPLTRRQKKSIKRRKDLVESTKSEKKEIETKIETDKKEDKVHAPIVEKEKIDNKNNEDKK